MRENIDLKVITLENIKNLKVHGRTTGRLSPLVLFWTGSGIELNSNSSELWIEIEADCDLYEPWITIAINSEPVSRLMLVSGRYWFCLFRGMNKGKVKNVRIFKDTQAMSDDPDHSLKIHAVKTDGTFYPIDNKPYKIEFIGDSITSGEGAIGAKDEDDWIPIWFSSVDNYTKMTADALNADYRVVSQSGWGVLSSWDNNPNNNIPKHYEQVCGLLTGGKNMSLGAFERNDFNSWQPNIVLVNLGTNDASAFTSPGWKDEQTGKVYKQELNADGSFNEESIKRFERAVENFLLKLRIYNKKAHIIWAYGMAGATLLPAIIRAIDSYKGKSGDKKVSALQLPDTTDETMGSRLHPGRLAHVRAAKELVGYIKTLL